MDMFHHLLIFQLEPLSILLSLHIEVYSVQGSVPLKAKLENIFFVTCCNFPMVNFPLHVKEKQNIGSI